MTTRPARSMVRSGFNALRRPAADGLDLRAVDDDVHAGAHLGGMQVHNGCIFQHDHRAASQEVSIVADNRLHDGAACQGPRPSRLIEGAHVPRAVHAEPPDLSPTRIIPDSPQGRSRGWCCPEIFLAGEHGELVPVRPCRPRGRKWRSCRTRCRTHRGGGSGTRRESRSPRARACWPGWGRPRRTSCTARGSPGTLRLGRVAAVLIRGPPAEGRIRSRAERRARGCPRRGSVHAVGTWLRLRAR